jgi:periplasmic protein TonB
MKPRSQSLHRPLGHSLWALSAVAFAWLSGCSSPPAPVKPTATSAPAPVTPAAKVPEKIVEPSGPTSLARSSKEYRKDAASHLYGLHAHRIYKGRMPPMLEAVGVLNVDIDQKGSVKAVNWMRAPKHAPHVMAEIERMVKTSAPYPVPKNMRQVTYTDVWLWHKSGKFQLDTLTEGQD